MVMYSPEASEIAKPSELLNSVKAYMNMLQGVEIYVNVDITRVLAMFSYYKHNRLVINYRAITNFFTLRVTPLTEPLHAVVQRFVAVEGVCWAHMLQQHTYVIRACLSSGSHSFRCRGVY